MAESVFDRAMTGAGAVAARPVDKAAAAGAAEIDRLMEGQSIASHLVALKAESRAA